jgi:glucose/arabinose dehydrogenase
VASNYYFYTITQTTPAFSGASSTYQSPLAVVDVWANASAVVTTLAGDGTGAFADGTGTSARFYTPYAVAALSNGNIVVADANNHRIRLVTTAGVVTTIAGNGTNTFADGTGTNARFNSPFGIAVLSNGNLVVADGDNHRIRLITMPGGVVTTLAGNGTPAFADGTGTAARFNTPHAVAVLPNGNIVVADYNNHRIRLVTPEGVVTTVAGDGNSAFADGTGTNARVNGPFGIATFQNGNILVVDTFNHRIRIITMPSGVVTTVAGDGNPAFLNGTGTNASFKVPFGAAVLPNGNIIVADTDNHRIRLITMPGGAVTTLAGGNYAFDNGTGTNASFRAPRSVAVLPNGSIAVADGDNHRIRLITPT